MVAICTAMGDKQAKIDLAMRENEHEAAKILEDDCPEPILFARNPEAGRGIKRGITTLLLT